MISPKILKFINLEQVSFSREKEDFMDTCSVYKDDFSPKYGPITTKISVLHCKLIPYFDNNDNN